MISVCMATHNGEKYLKQQLDSILCQLGDRDEVIISDDGSTDSTLDIIRGFQDFDARYFYYHCDDYYDGHGELDFGPWCHCSFASQHDYGKDCFWLLK